MNAQINFMNALQVQGVATEADWNELTRINKAIRESRDALEFRGLFKDDDNRGEWVVFKSAKGGELYCKRV